MAQSVIDAARDLSIRTGVPWGEGNKQGAGAIEYLLLGKSAGKTHRALIDFSGLDDALEGVTVLTSAVLVLTTSEVLLDVTSAECIVHRLTEAFTEGASPTYEDGAFENPNANTGESWPITLSPSANGEASADVTTLVGAWMPPDKQYLDGTILRAGRGLPRHGIRIRAKDEDTASQAGEIHSRESGTGQRRARIELFFESAHAPEAPSPMSPSGFSLPDVPFTGLYSDIDQDPPGGIRVQAREVASQIVVWDVTLAANPSWPVDLGVWTWDIPSPGSAIFRGNSYYEWRARATDLSGEVSPFSPWLAFIVSGSPPTIAPRPYGTVETLRANPLMADWGYGSGNRIDAYAIELRPRLATASPNWDDPLFPPLWRLLVSPPTETERNGGFIQRDYTGPSLDPGGYSVRYRVVSEVGIMSDWAYDHTIVTTARTIGDDRPDASTAFDKQSGTTRIILRDIDVSSTAKGTRRRPGAVVAIIDDAQNIGVSEYVNDIGELFFTIPVDHPQAGECEPYRRHYEVEQYRGAEWKLIAEGMLTEYDADQDQVVVYGWDYMGMLAVSMDSRFPADLEDFEKTHAEGGAKYSKEFLSDVIKDQLLQARDDLDSPLGFINIGQIDPLDSAGERAKVTIYSAFVRRLEFITGLIQSHKRGLGIKTRISQWRNPAKPEGAQWEWRLQEQPGIRRDNLRMEFGSIVQGFRVIPMGEFSSRMHGVGRQSFSVKPWYFRYPVEGNALPTSEFFGNIGKANVWEDVSDKADLKRRTQQMYAEAIAIGKHVALGLKVHGINYKDGYSLTDDIPLDLDRGVVDTDEWGTGYWTIWGHEYRVFPDGHDEVTLVIRPEETAVPQTPDIADSDPVNPGSGVTDVGCGPPPADLPHGGGVKYLDVCSGVIYCYDFELEQWVRCGLTRNDLTEWPIDIFAGQALNDAGCSFGGFIGIDFERTLEGDTPVDIYDASNDAMVVLFQNPAIKRVRDSTDGWHVNWNDGRFTGQCLTFSEEFFGRSRSEYLLHVTHPWLTEAMHPCMSGRLSFDVAVAGAVLFEPPPIDLYATTSDVAPSSSLELIDAGMDASELQAAGYFRIPGEWHDLGGGQWRLDCWVPGFFFSGTETWLRLAGNIESLPGDENGGICSPTLQFPRDIGLAGSYQYNVFLIVSGPYAPDLSLNIWSEAYQILDETITYDLGPTIIEGEPFGQPSWTTPFHWSVPVPNEKGTYERDSGLRVKTRVGEEQTFTLPDEHGDAPWSQDFTTLLRFTHPGGGPTIPKSHIGFIWEGEQGYAEAWAEFGGLDFPQGVRVVGATSDFLPLTIATGMLHTLKMRVSNGRVYAKVWPDSDPEPTAWQVSALYDATRITGIAQLHIVVGAGIDDIFDPNAPMANSVFVQGLYGAIGPLPGQVIEDEPVGEGDGGTNEFPTEHPSNPASADIYVDGLHVVPVAFNPVTGGYVLDANPSPGAEVVIDYESA